ncbi:MAG: transcriptional repressor [Pseudomonadota bacterium]
MKPEIAIFQEFLKKRGMRQTREREAIIREALSTDDHFDVDELFIRLKKKDGVSKASIYRTIPLMIEAGLLAEVYLENGHMHYEHVFGRDHHCHLRCRQCKKIIEFFDHRLGEIERDISQRFGFTGDEHKMEILGLCSECRNGKGV